MAGKPDKPDPKADEGYSEEEAARRRDATIKAMIAMPPKPHPSRAPKVKMPPASTGQVRKAKLPPKGQV
jgi:hypothetical protein